MYFDLWPEQTCHYKVMHRKEVTHSNGQYLKEITWVDLADEMGQGKAHDTPIDWCTGREWPVNCTTVISAGWRSIMPFQRSSGRSSGRWTIIQLGQDRSQVTIAASWRRSYRRDVVGKATSSRRGLGNPDGVWGTWEVADKM